MNKPATGTEGCLIRCLDGFMFRVYNQDGTFVDYDIAHSNMQIKIIDNDAWFYNQELIDHSPTTLGINNENS